VTEEVQDAILLSIDSPLDSWILDSGASFHTTAICEILENYVAGDFGKVYLADGSALDIVGMGDVRIRVHSDSVWKLQKVKYVPELKKNLISVGQLDEEGHAISFHGGRWKVSTGARILARGYKTDTLYMTANRDRVNETFGHGFLDDQNQKIIRSRKITFNEHVVYKDRLNADRAQEGEALTDSQKGKQVVEVELDKQRSLTDEGDDEESSGDSRHRKEPGSGDPLSVQNGTPKEVELLQKGKAWESVGLLKRKRDKCCRWVYRKKESSEKARWPSGLVEKHGGLSKPCHMLKFKRNLDLSGTCGL
jgi:hypothetical protein